MIALLHSGRDAPNEEHDLMNTQKNRKAGVLKKKHKTRNFLSILIALVMVLGMLPLCRKYSRFA